MSYNVAEYVIGWRFNGQHDGDKMTDISPTVFVWSINEVLKWTDTHTYSHAHTHTHTHTYSHACTHTHTHTYKHTHT